MCISIYQVRLMLQVWGPYFENHWGRKCAFQQSMVLPLTGSCTSGICCHFITKLTLLPLVYLEKYFPLCISPDNGKIKKKKKRTVCLCGSKEHFNMFKMQTLRPFYSNLTLLAVLWQLSHTQEEFANKPETKDFSHLQLGLSSWLWLLLALWPWKAFESY